MRSFKTMFMSDLRYGIVQVLLRHTLVFAVALFVCFMTYTLVVLNAEASYIELNLTTGDIILCLLGGMAVYDPGSGREFEVPIAWLSLFVATAYVTLDYPLHDLHGVGATTIVISGSRWSWWLAKCCWVISNVIIVCFVWALVIALFIRISGATPSLTPTHNVILILGFFGKGGHYEPDSFLIYALSVLPLLISILLVQLLVSLFTGPYIALAVTVGILFLSTFYMSPYLLGEYLLAARNAALMIGGVDSFMGIAFGLGVSLFCIFGGGFIFKHIDILAGKARNND